MHRHKSTRIRHRASAQKEKIMDTKPSVWARVKGFFKNAFAKKAAASNGPSLWARMAAAAKKATRKVAGAARSVYRVVVRPIISLVRDFTVLIAIALWLTAFIVLPLETMFFTGIGIIALCLAVLGIEWLWEKEYMGNAHARRALNIIDAFVAAVWLVAQLVGGAMLSLSAAASLHAFGWTLVAVGIYIGADQIAKKRGEKLVTVGDEVERALSIAVDNGAVRVPFGEAPTAEAAPAA